MRKVRSNQVSISVNSCTELSEAEFLSLKLIFFPKWKPVDYLES